MSSRPDALFGAINKKLLPPNYLSAGIQALVTRDKRFQQLFEERKWPQDGWDDLSIEMLLNQFAAMDSNNFLSKCGVGEREARIYSFSQEVKAAFLCPMATGMSLTLILLALKREKPKAKFVVWPRIDQKSCFKSIITAGLEPLVVVGKLDGDEVRTNVEEVESAMKVYGPENVLCVLTTTSCFAPRACDSLEEVSKLCKAQNIFHVVNNAYGLQSGKCSYQIQQGSKVGRLDVFVQSTDKNLMVPVGGAIIAGFNEELVQKIRQTYPGRASSSQSLDVFITLLSMGSTNYRALLKKRKENFVYLRQTLEALAARVGERVIATQNNQISIAMTLDKVGVGLEEADRQKALTEIGSMLFKRNVEGSRVVTSAETKTIENHQFRGWGSHCSKYPKPYITAAATIGMERSDVDTFVKKLEDCLKKVKGRRLSKTVEDPD